MNGDESVKHSTPGVFVGYPPSAVLVKSKTNPDNWVVHNTSDDAVDALKDAYKIFTDAWVNSTAVPVPASASASANTAATYNETLIQGKMFKASYVIDHFTWENSDKEAIKMKMIHEIVAELIKGGAVEFTSIVLPHEMKVRINARLFVTPNDQVRILREKGY